MHIILCINCQEQFFIFKSDRTNKCKRLHLIFIHDVKFRLSVFTDKFHSICKKKKNFSFPHNCCNCKFVSTLFISPHKKILKALPWWLCDVIASGAFNMRPLQTPFLYQYMCLSVQNLLKAGHRKRTSSSQSPSGFRYSWSNQGRFNV